MILSRTDFLDLDASGNSTGSFIVEARETASTTVNLKAFGVSIVPYTTADNTFTLDAPITGVRKSIIMNSTLAPDAVAKDTNIYTGSTAIFIKDNSTTYNPKLYASLQPPFASLELLGLSTSEWGVIGSHGAVQFSTAAGYTT